MPSSDTQFQPKPPGEALDRKPICCKFEPETAAILRAMPDRSAFIREAVRVALQRTALPAIALLVLVTGCQKPAPPSQAKLLESVEQCLAQPLGGQCDLANTYGQQTAEEHRKAGAPKWCDLYATVVGGSAFVYGSSRDRVSAALTEEQFDSASAQAQKNEQLLKDSRATYLKTCK